MRFNARICIREISQLINVNIYMTFALLASLLQGCNGNLYQIAYAPKTSPPEVTDSKHEWNREKKFLYYSLDGVQIYVRSEISLTARSETIFFVETNRTPYSHESFNYISVSLSSKTSGAFISDISGILSRTDSKYIVKPEIIYYADQQACSTHFMISDEFILRDKNVIPIRQQDNFDGIKRWSKDSKLLATSCFQFIYPETMVIDANTIYKMIIGKLKSLDGREQELEIYLKPSFLHSRSY